MLAYLNLLKDILENGEEREDRTGTGTLSVFGRQLRCNLAEGFPLLTTKKLHFKSIAYELLWFLKGDTNVGYLKDHGVRIWNEWADEDGNLGPVYGAQWRSWGSADGKKIDQLAGIVEGLKERPYDRRHLCCSWNVGELSKMALPPCHVLFQFYVSAPKVEGGKKRLSLQLYQRSADVFLGVPFNIASYALLLKMMAQVCDMEAFEFVHTFGDVHLYKNHLEQAQIQGKRSPGVLPKLAIKNRGQDLFSFEFEDFEVQDYVAQPHIKAKVSV